MSKTHPVSSGDRDSSSGWVVAGLQCLELPPLSAFCWRFQVRSWRAIYPLGRPVSWMVKFNRCNAHSITLGWSGTSSVAQVYHHHITDVSCDVVFPPASYYIWPIHRNVGPTGKHRQDELVQVVRFGSSFLCLPVVISVSHPCFGVVGNIRKSKSLPGAALW